MDSSVADDVKYQTTEGHCESNMQRNQIQPDHFQAQQPCLKFSFRLLSLFIMMTGPIGLIYMVLRCEKNQCILFQLPLVIPTHLGAYFSTLAFSIVVGFIVLMFLLSAATAPDRLQDTPSLSTGTLALVCCSLSIFTLGFINSDLIRILHGEYLRMVVATTIVCLVTSLILFAINTTNWEYCTVMSFFYGTTRTLHLGNVEVKYFIYVHLGLVAWASLDEIIALNAIFNFEMTAQLAYLLVTQLLVIGHKLYFESYLAAAPFMEFEALGFLWLMRMGMYVPFLNSLLLYHAANTEIVVSGATIAVSSLIFGFGFIIYAGSLSQKQDFIDQKGNLRSMRSIGTRNGNRILISGYWSLVQKPDYLGQIIIWTSWTVASGFSTVSIIVLIIVLAMTIVWLGVRRQIKKGIFGATWRRYDAVHSCCFHPKCAVVAVGTCVARWLVLDLSTHEIVSVHTDGNEQIECIQYSPDGSMLAIGSWNNFIYLYSVSEDGNKYSNIGRCSGHSSFITHIDWSADGLYLASNSGDYELLYWKVSSCKILTNISVIREQTND